MAKRRRGNWRLWNWKGEFKMLPDGIETQLWQHVVRENGTCWTVLNPTGDYRRFWFGGKQWSSHRVSYELAHGPIPDGSIIKHSCDNPPCCNPNHLSAGTKSSNIKESIERKRFKFCFGKGENAGAAKKLTFAKVVQIKSLLSCGAHTQNEIANMFGVGQGTISDINIGRRWAGSAEELSKKSAPTPNCKCLGCGKAFYVAPCFLKRSKRNFCNAQCKKEKGSVALFWNKVDKRGPDDCWNWRGAKSEFGHGIASSFIQQTTAHRIVWKLDNKRDVPKGFVVRHKCHNPSCVNPAHLKLGSSWENTQDMIRAGRTNGPKGERAANHKLVTAEVALIKQLIIDGVANKQVGLMFGVHYMTINAIRKRHSWAHI